MAGNVAMALGPFAFEAIGFGYEAVQRRLQTPWTEMQVAQDLNQLQWMGPSSDEVTIRGVLFPVEFGGQSSLAGIVEAATSGLPLTLVSGDESEGLIHGVYVVQSVDEDRTSYTGYGAPRKNAYTIMLKKYGGSSVGGLLSNIINLF
ncbi:MAG: phage tail protein [Delftia acidovorans]|nr:MAG: phage tail protein [Delftia acidovorans]